jgi:hypothetical protein
MDPTVQLTPQERAEAEERLATIHTLSPPTWVIDEGFINENQKPFEFDKHRFMIQPYSDMSPDQVIIKSAQVGWSVLAIIRSVHAAKFLKLNVIYVLPTRNATHDFVIPKVNPMLDRNPKLKALLRNTDSVNLKAVGDRFIYFRGAFHRGEAISTTADLVVSDEHDISDQSVLTIYQSRLQASEWGWFWRFSNPTLPGFGVDELWQESDQMHWIITCRHCGHRSYMDFERDEVLGNHYVFIVNDVKDHEEAWYACGGCHKDISNDDRQGGEWHPKYPGRPRRGYWLNQLMVPWVSATKIIKQQNDMPIDVWHNFVLGKPYQASEFVINGDAVLRACNPGLANKTDVIIGCDSGKIKHWVMGNREGIFAYGTTNSWLDIERLILTYNATAVIDALPDFTIPERLARKYPGQVFVHYYVHDTKSMNVTAKKEGEEFGVLQSDRTKLFDDMAGRITSGKLRFFQTKEALTAKGGIIYHFENMYRIVEEDSRGIKRARWETKTGKPDHLAHAAAYYVVGLSQAIFTGEAGGVTPRAPTTNKTTYAVDGETQTAPITQVMGRPMEDFIEASLRKNKRRRVS